MEEYLKFKNYVLNLEDEETMFLIKVLNDFEESQRELGEKNFS